MNIFICLFAIIISLMVELKYYQVAEQELFVANLQTSCLMKKNLICIRHEVDFVS